MKPKRLKIVMSLLGLALMRSAIAAETNQLVKALPDDSQGLSNRWFAYAKKGEWDNAISDFGEAVHVNTNSALAYECRGAAYFMKGNWDDAITDFSRAIQLEPTNDLAYFSRGSSYRAKDEFDKAIGDFNQSLKLNPTNGLAFTCRAAAYKSKGEFKKALEDVTEGLRLDPKDATAVVMLGALHGLVGQFEEAIRDYREAIRIDPKHDEAYNDLAWLRATCLIASARDGKDAVEAATRACELTDWRRWDYLDTLAAAFAEAGDFEQAVKYQKQVMSMNTLTEKARIRVQHRLELYQQQKPYHAALTP